MTATESPKPPTAPPGKALVKVSPLNAMAERFQIEPGKLLDVLKSTVIRPTDKHQPTNEEIAAFVMVANEYGLNPFTREIHAFIGQNSCIVPIVGIDGWARIVNNHKDFDGCDFEEKSDSAGAIQSTTCIMHVKGREHPVKVTEWFSECVRQTTPWKQMPRRMLRHKAYIQAARLCFGFAGIYDEDEGSDFASNRPASPWASVMPEEPPTGRVDLRNGKKEAPKNRIAPTLPPPPAPDKILPETRKELDYQLRRLEFSQDDIGLALQHFKTKSLDDLTQEQATAWISSLVQQGPQPGTQEGSGLQFQDDFADEWKNFADQGMRDIREAESEGHVKEIVRQLGDERERMGSLNWRRIEDAASGRSAELAGRKK